MADTRSWSRVAFEGGVLRWFDSMDSWNCIHGGEAYYRSGRLSTGPGGNGKTLEQRLEDYIRQSEKNFEEEEKEE